jgi:hypothetical protein
MQPDVFLHANDFGDCLVFDRAQIRRIDLATREFFARGQQVLWPQETTDVIGA